MSKKQKLELTWIGKEERPKLEPRILIEDSAKSYGESKSGNMLIQGDNLLALKALEQGFSGKVKCIYIDPPYNTGSAFQHYDDGIEHSLWLSLIRDRLIILRRLLAEDGTIWVSIDDNEQAYLKVLMDEIFGRSNFRTCITWQRKYSVSNNYRGIATICDYLLVYSKSHLFQNNLLPRTQESKNRYANPDNDPRGPWKSVDYLNQATPEQRRNLCYDIINPNTGQVIRNNKKAWKFDPTTHKKHVDEKKLWWGRDGKNTVPALKLFLSEVRDGMTPHNWWPHDEVGHTDESKKESIVLFGAKAVFDTPKPERLLHRILTIATNPGDLVLDSFAGSGTTGAVAHKMGRKWVMVELGEHANSHCLSRVKKVVNGKDGLALSERLDWKGGGGFKFYNLASSLLKKDKYGNWVIDESYNANMLAAAMCQHEGFVFSPDPEVYWKHGHSTENDYIFVTTSFMSATQIDKIHEEMKSGESLLICTRAFAPGSNNRHSNITIKKIPQLVLGKCEFGKDNYNLNIIDLPRKEDEEEEELPKKRKVSRKKERSIKTKVSSPSRKGKQEELFT